MGIFIYILISIIAIVIQTTLFSAWPFLTVVPDLVLVLVVLFSLINGPSFGLKFGFFAGLGLDLLIGEMIGLGALTKMIIGLAVGLGARRFYKENYIIPLVSVIVATLVDQCLYAVGMVIFAVPVPITVIIENFLPLVIYNGILCLLLYLRLFYLNEKIIYWDELFKRSG